MCFGAMSLFCAVVSVTHTSQTEWKYLGVKLAVFNDNSPIYHSLWFKTWSFLICHVSFLEEEEIVFREK